MTSRPTIRKRGTQLPRRATSNRPPSSFGFYRTRRRGFAVRMLSIRNTVVSKLLSKPMKQEIRERITQKLHAPWKWAPSVRAFISTLGEENEFARAWKVTQNYGRKKRHTERERVELGGAQRLLTLLSFPHDVYIHETLVNRKKQITVLVGSQASLKEVASEIERFLTTDQEKEYEHYWSKRR